MTPKTTEQLLREAAQELRDSVSELVAMLVADDFKKYRATISRICVEADFSYQRIRKLATLSAPATAEPQQITGEQVEGILCSATVYDETSDELDSQKLAEAINSVLRATSQPEREETK